MSVHELIQNSRKELVDKLIEKMESGENLFKNKALWTKNALSPYNPLSGYTYSGGNRFRLMMSAMERGYRDPRWMTYRQAKEAGYQVKRSQKSTLLEKWIFTKVIKEKNQKGELEEKTIKLAQPFPNYFRVFNAEQMDGIPSIPNIVPLTRDAMLDTADLFIKSSQCSIKEMNQNHAYYSAKEDMIVLPPRDFFKNQESFLTVTLHEMAHSTGHESRLNRPLVNKFGTPDYAREELNAELASVFIQADLNINLQGELLEDHAAYLKSWIKILENDPGELFRACRLAEQASSYLVNHYQAGLVQTLEHEELSPKGNATLRMALKYARQAKSFEKGIEFLDQTAAQYPEDKEGGELVKKLYIEDAIKVDLKSVEKKIEYLPKDTKLEKPNYKENFQNLVKTLELNLSDPKLQPEQLEGNQQEDINEVMEDLEI